MKNSIGELNKTVIALIAIFLISVLSSIVFGLFKNKILYLITGSEDYNIEDEEIINNSEYKKIKIDTPTINKNNINYDNVKLLEANISIGIKSNGGYSVNNKEKETLESLIKNETNLDSNNIIYNKINDNEYLVYYSDSVNNYYYIYNKNDQNEYNLSSKASIDINKNSNINNNLANSEKEEQFNINTDYYDIYLSKASNSFSNNNNLITNIYNNNIDKIVILNTYNNETITRSASGFFIDDGIIVTSWKYINDSLEDGNSITCLTNNNNNYTVDGIMNIDTNADIVLLKINSDNNSKVSLGNINTNEEVLLLGTYSGFGLSGKVGKNISNNNFGVNSLSVTYNNIGSPIFNQKGEVIGMVTSNFLDKDISSYISSEEIKKYIDYYKNKKIEFYKFNELSKKYFKYNLIEEKQELEINNKVWDKYKKIGDLENSIGIDLVKINSFDNYFSLRYKNNSLIENDSVLSVFIDNLKNDKYNEVLNTNKKKIFKNHDYEITIFYDFDYIIITIRSI